MKTKLEPAVKKWRLLSTEKHPLESRFNLTQDFEENRLSHLVSRKVLKIFSNSCFRKPCQFLPRCACQKIPVNFIRTYYILESGTKGVALLGKPNNKFDKRNYIICPKCHSDNRKREDRGLI